MTVKLSDRAREEAVEIVTRLAKHSDGAKMDDFRNALEMTDGQIRGVIATAKLVREGSKKYASYRAPARARGERRRSVVATDRRSESGKPVGAREKRVAAKKAPSYNLVERGSKKAASVGRKRAGKKRGAKK